jgi:hypothetical protein
MSRILVVEPRRILRQAISLALFPDHQVDAATGLSDRHAAGTLDCDMVIIDAAGLRETGYSHSDLAATVRKWKIPTVWINDAEGDQAPARDELVVLNTPILKDALQGVIATYLGPSSIKQNGAPNTAVRERSTPKDAETAAESQVPQIIELVDVVAEPPERRKNKSKK